MYSCIQAIVYGWDLWYIDFDADTPALIRITDDGEENKVYNGIPDWVYEGKIKIKLQFFLKKRNMIKKKKELNFNLKAFLCFEIRKTYYLKQYKTHKK